MNKRIQSALISVFYKDGLETIINLLKEQDVTIYSTGGTQDFIEKLGAKVIPVEALTTYPSILGGSGQNGTGGTGSRQGGDRICGAGSGRVGIAITTRQDGLTGPCLVVGG